MQEKPELVKGRGLEEEDNKLYREPMTSQQAHQRSLCVAEGQYCPGNHGCSRGSLSQAPDGFSLRLLPRGTVLRPQQSSPAGLTWLLVWVPPTWPSLPLWFPCSPG